MYTGSAQRIENVLVCNKQFQLIKVLLKRLRGAHRSQNKFVFFTTTMLAHLKAQACVAAC